MNKQIMNKFNNYSIKVKINTINFMNQKVKN